MSSDEIRDRLLIALAKFLGESPTKLNPLANVLVCEDWFLAELLEPVVPSENKVALNLERFNQLMLACGRARSSEHFYDYFFRNVSTIDNFEEAVESFRIKAMWLFGNFKFAYKKLATQDVSIDAFSVLIARTEPRSDSEFSEREEFTDIQPIPEEDLGFLGYVSGQKLDDLDFAIEAIKLLSAEGIDRVDFLRRLGQDNARKLSDVLSREQLEFPAEEEGIDQKKISSILLKLEPELRARRDRQVNAQRIGIRNTQRYLTLPYLDVYVATSMRSEEDYVAQSKFLQNVFQNPLVRDLKLRYFDPTASFDPDRIKKGLIECLMLRRAKVTIYNAGARRHYG